MSEVSDGSRTDLFQPGNIIELSDTTQLAAFEDLLAQEVDPMYDPILWAKRPALRDLIRPPKFNGTIADIKLEVMSEPYERLMDAKQRGWTMMGKAYNLKLTSELAEEIIPRYRGFILTAQPKSSRPGLLGQIQAELWYYPKPFHIHSRAGSTGMNRNTLKSGEVRERVITRKTNTIQTSGSSRAEAIRRVVTKPKMETEQFIEHHEAAKRIGFQVLRQQMTQPISAPMRD